jgi:hypothetical protein
MRWSIESFFSAQKIRWISADWFLDRNGLLDALMLLPLRRGRGIGVVGRMKVRPARRGMSRDHRIGGARTASFPTALAWKVMNGTNRVWVSEIGGCDGGLIDFGWTHRTESGEQWRWPRGSHLRLSNEFLASPPRRT